MNRNPKIGGSLVALACGVVLLLGFGPLVSAQDDECHVGDYACVDEQFGSACVARSMGATTETCVTLLQSLLQRADADAPEMQVTIGYTYLASGQFSEVPQTGQSYREQSAAIFEQLRGAEYPVNVRVSALYGLMAAAVSHEERVEHLRSIVAIDPSNLQAAHHLADELRNRGGIPGLIEGVDVLQHAFTESSGADVAARLRLAFGVAHRYRRLVNELASSDPTGSAEAQAGLEAFLDRAREDFRWNSLLRDVHQDPVTDPAQTATALAIICRDHAVSTFGPHDCVESLMVVADAAARSGGTTGGLQLADAAASTMASLSIDGWRFLRAYPDWPDRVTASLRQLLSSGMETAAVFSAYAQFESDPESRLIALQRGATLFPTDGDVALFLGLEYLRHGIHDQAIEHLLVAQDEVPSHVQGRVDGLLRMARGEADLPAEM